MEASADTRSLWRRPPNASDATEAKEETGVGHLLVGGGGDKVGELGAAGGQPQQR
ncbi:hypothetical protein GCM10022403_080060 [Streptomyces coacervatus]|uniref:Uncharacterized protein n=1 Tax=Streptomyces coacervatus TaxID=647381 RepID=A0ABP7J6V6_9ACTN